MSNGLEAVFCVDCLEEDLRIYGKPEIFNSDKGSRFTSDAFTGVPKKEGVVISMDGRGRAFNKIFVERCWCNVKHEDVYPKGYSSMDELTSGLTEYFTFYNGQRPHQSLGFKTPAIVYRSAMGGGAMIVDKYPRAVEEPKTETTARAVPGQRRPGCYRSRMYSLNSAIFCLDAGVHFT